MYNSRANALVSEESASKHIDNSSWISGSLKCLSVCPLPVPPTFHPPSLHHCRKSQISAAMVYVIFHRISLLL